MPLGFSTHGSAIIGRCWSWQLFGWTKAKSSVLKSYNTVQTVKWLIMADTHQFPSAPEQPLSLTGCSVEQILGTVILVVGVLIAKAGRSGARELLSHRGPNVTWHTQIEYSFVWHWMNLETDNWEEKACGQILWYCEGWYHTKACNFSEWGILKRGAQTPIYRTHALEWPSQRRAVVIVVVLLFWNYGILRLKFSGKSHPFSHSQNWKKSFKIGRICWWHHYISSPSVRKQTLDPGTVVRIRIFWILQICGQRCKQRRNDVPDWRDGIGIHGDYGQRTQPPVIIAACRIFVHEDSLRPPLSLLSTRTVQRNLGGIKEVLQLADFWWCSGLQLRELPKVWQVTVGVFSNK